MLFFCLLNLIFLFGLNIMKTLPLFFNAHRCQLNFSISYLLYFLGITFLSFGSCSAEATSFHSFQDYPMELGFSPHEGQNSPDGNTETPAAIDRIETPTNRVGSSSNRVFIYLFIASVILAFGLIGLIFYFLKRLKVGEAKYKELKSQFEILLGEQDTNYKELAASSINILKTTGLLSSVRQRLLEANLVLSKQDEIKFKEIISELKENVNSGKAWIEFDMRFQKVHHLFYSELLKTYPTLSPNELKLCAFLKLNMSTKEISAITFQSVKSLTIARYRLRKKLGLTQDANLVNYISKI